ncbi:MAG: class I SAM-dependent methyltransferase [Vicingaceae bacterium]
MKAVENYLSINKETWNKKTAVHVDSEFYDNDNFIKGKSSLNDIELAQLGNIEGKSILHLQCHFGQGTISLTRLGAKATGVDLSDKAIETAKDLATKTNSDATFICCDVYSLPEHLNEQFDIVYTSYGTIGWLPDMDKWATIVSQYLKPKGTFIIVDFHPTLWMYDDDFEFIQHNYFNDEAIIENFEGTYADKNAPISQDCVTWNHPTSEVINNLIKHNLTINSFDEFDYSPYDCFNKTIEFEPGKFRIKHLDNKLPMVFAIKATKNEL